MDYEYVWRMCDIGLNNIVKMLDRFDVIVYRHIVTYVDVAGSSDICKFETKLLPTMR